MTEAEIDAYFEANIDLKYRDFHAKLVPTVSGFMGIRTPVIKALAKQIARGDWKTYLDTVSASSYEQTMLRGQVIGNVKCDFADIEPYILDFVPRIDNWATCDTFCGALKITLKHRDEMWGIIERFLRSDREYEVRFAAVMLMGYYLDDKYIDRVLKIYSEISHEAYYVRMAVAWGLSYCFIKHRDKTIKLLETKMLDSWTHNKAIQKSRESLRVTAADKALLLTLKM